MLRNTPRSPIFISNALLCGKCRHNRGSTVRAVSNGWVSTADRIAVSVIKFDRAARASHSPGPHRLDRNRANLERFMPSGLRILYHGGLSIR
jgi:hypothetical protein